MRFSIVLFWITTVMVTGRAQPAEVLDNNRPSVRFRQIRTPHFRVLYPQGFDATAQRVANTLEHIRLPEAQSLQKPPRRFTVVLQNQTAISNGFVSLLPRRAEFYTMPPQNYNFTGTVDWLDQLAAHEYRHMVQFDRSRTGLNKLAYYAFGPATLAGLAQMAAPLWFWEGDAVTTETAFTTTGRGRIPQFGLVMRTNVTEGRIFNYHKQYLRSYKHFIPDHYVLGYHLVSYLRRRTGDPLIWDRITQRAWRFPFMPFAFSNAIRKETGMYVTELYQAMAADLKRYSDSLIARQPMTSFQIISPPTPTGYTDYQYPQVLANGRILAWKRGIGHIDELVWLENKKDRHVFTPGIIVDNGMLSASGTRIVWTEYTFHPRWRRETYSDIRMYDVHTRKLRHVTTRGRYMAPALSPDTTRIVAIESATDYTTAVVILDTHGNVLSKWQAQAGVFYSMPRWSDNGKKIVALKTTRGRRSVVAFDAATGREEVLVSETEENIGHPVLYREWLLFNSPDGGIDNVYALHLPSGRRYKVTASHYGAYNPVVSADGRMLYFNEQSRDGLIVAAVPFNPNQWWPHEPTPNSRSFFQHLVEQEGYPNLLGSVPQNQYPAKPYRRLSGFFNPYSWGAYFNTALTQADIGLVSQDVLSTVSWRAGYLYNISDRTGMWRLGVSYQNWFPIADVNVLFGPRELNEGNITYYRITGTDTVLTTDKLRFNWYEKTVEAGLRLPLITTRSRFLGNVTISNYVGYTQISDFTNSITGSGRIITPEIPVYWLRDYSANGKLIYNHFSVSAYRLLKRSRRDINSRWGQAFFLNGYGTPFGQSDYTGNQFSFYTLLYFPGLFRHHSLWGYWGYQRTYIELLTRSGPSQPVTDNNLYFFPNRVPLPRGLSVFRDQKFYTLSVNYTLPVWYPDVAIGPLVNFQRLRLNGFVDYAFGTSRYSPTRVGSTTYLSAGAEARLDINLLRFLPQLDVGVRLAYALQPVQATTFEILIGTINF
ncbi:MAG: hypothetical protein KatS3mg032_2291 [Cyclobacteriaceae bacterium]|nr:MAG: hypothetical protein KatS3mg032_2291 [Cyclobacteriaceae bacterium]